MQRAVRTLGHARLAPQLVGGLVLRWVGDRLLGIVRGQGYSGMGEYKLLLKDFPSFNSQQIFSLKKIPLFGFFSPKSLGNLCKSP